MNVFWLEQTETDVPGEGDWLNAREVVQRDAMRFAKRRTDWLLGRWTAKQALAACLCLPADHLSLAQIELRPSPSGAPEVFLNDRPSPVAVSLSHREGVAACAIALEGGALGCDLETIEPRSNAFVSDYFTLEEQQLVARTPENDRPRLLALLWSAKESALKALHAGLRLDTRYVRVLPPIMFPPQVDSGGRCAEYAALGVQPTESLQPWLRLHIHCDHGQFFHGWWKQTGRFVRSVVAAGPSLPPIPLTPSAHFQQ